MGESAEGAPARGRKVYVTVHEHFVREGLRYMDKETGEERMFNVVRLPEGVEIDGKDVGGYEFSPLFVDPARFKGEDYRDVPLLRDREVWLRKSVLDPEGNPVLDDEGRRVKDTVVATPQQIKDALAEGRRRWAEGRGGDSRLLGERAGRAREASTAMGAPGGGCPRGGGRAPA